uniref:proto-oncogene tyrosine-protein kinase ROS isoform X2 n=1 Tax=Ciona intestinalis TaxID=7719 RepID=UPI000EF44C9F|nr:proto-oncogene tyrosine-protein kinase ROS isoform X2 [Ciona intestinalis]|eukprot:XP_026693888.1 proto-oncogene tyrosine-protein kinase ROS isoform X2 [Ciona intestinalis]
MTAGCQMFEEGIYICGTSSVWFVTLTTCSCSVVHHDYADLSLLDGGLFWIVNNSKLFLRNMSVVSSYSSSTNNPNIVCPMLINELPSVTDVRSNSIVFNVSDIMTSQPNHCVSSTSVYSFLYKQTNSNYIEQSTTLFSFTATLIGLNPNVNYEVKFTIHCFYADSSSQVMSLPVYITTKCKAPHPPSQLECHPRSPQLLSLSWSPRTNQVLMNITYQVTSPDGMVHYDVNNARVFEHQTTMGGTYTVGSTIVGCNTSSTSSITCRPYTIHPINVRATTSDSITVGWEQYRPGVVQIVVSWKLLSNVLGNNWIDSLPLGGSATMDTITDLMSGTGYAMRATVVFPSGASSITDILSVQTRRGTPNAPTNPTIEGVTPYGVLTWQPPDTSTNILEYSIEARNRTPPSSHRRLFGVWKIVKNVSVNGKREWMIGGLTQNVWFQFRVFARNNVGRGDASLTTAPYLFTLPASDSRFRWMVIGSSVGSFIFVSIIIFIIACWRCRVLRRRKKKLRHLRDITTIRIDSGMDVELARVRHMTNLAMAAANHEGRINLPTDYRDRLPIYPRDQLKLGMLIGSGAFGEVYKGTAAGISGGEGEASVAVKTLKDGASENEKMEFLMEAYFMSLFDHRNIISLLGVCLDNEPQFLILELMEGGDLLKYLRHARPTQMMSSKLSFLDLIDICLDLSAGCKYLESQHFIHRDLAARNCLVSSKDYQCRHRVVKIGDFGLARDIYRNDYYLKEGEGLLPVRWMAPESLMMKLYTVQSDVWSFGVLLWEVMTFGQQPYPEFTNTEVIHFVKEGGRLEQPHGCPEPLYEVMRECWEVEPRDRPSFNDVLVVLQECKGTCSPNTIPIDPPSTSSINYSLMSPSTDEGFVNGGFTSSDENIVSSCYAELRIPPPTNQPNVSTHETSQLNYAQLGFSPSRQVSTKNPTSETSSHYNELPIHKTNVVVSNLLNTNQYVMSPKLKHEATLDDGRNSNEQFVCETSYNNLNYRCDDEVTNPACETTQSHNVITYL